MKLNHGAWTTHDETTLLKHTKLNFNANAKKKRYRWGPVAKACNRDNMSVKKKWIKVIEMNGLNIDFNVLANWKNLQHGDLKWQGDLICPSAAKPYNNKQAKKRREKDWDYAVSNMEIDVSQSIEEYEANLEKTFDN